MSSIKLKSSMVEASLILLHHKAGSARLTG